VNLYGWVVLGHVLAVILALAAHGVSAFAMFRIRKEHERARLAAILDLSSSAVTVAGIAFLVAIVLGVAGALIDGQFSKLWPWASIVVLVVVIGAMTPLAAIPMNRVRRVLAVAVPGDRTGHTVGEAGTDDELAAALAAIRPEIPTAIGVAGVAILAWLMRAKPF